MVRRENDATRRYRWDAGGNALKARVLEEMRLQGLAGTAAAQAIGINYGTLRSWLQLSDRLLVAHNLTPIATWLGLSTEEAQQLQGGDGDDRLSAGKPRVLTNRRCPTCRVSFRPAKANSRFCSRQCAFVPRRKYRAPVDAFGRFLRDQAEQSGFSNRAFAKSIGISQVTLNDLLDGHAPAPATLAKLYATFGAAMPNADAAITRRREQQAGNIVKARRALTPESQARAGATRRGRPRDPQASAKSIETRRKSGALDRMIEGRTRWNSSPYGRAMRSLWARLQTSPAPTNTQLAKWAAATATTVQMDTEAVRGIWRPELEKRGIITPRKHAAKTVVRCNIIRELSAAWPRTPTGRYKRGFWDEAMRRIGEKEGAAAPAYVELKVWWDRHPATCPNVSKWPTDEEKLTKLSPDLPENAAYLGTGGD